MARWILACGLLAALAGLSGCTELTLATVDAKMSELAEADCHYTDLLLTGTYCKSRQIEGKQAKLYCFRTIGGVDCYDQTDPYAINQSGRALQPTPRRQRRTGDAAPRDPPAAVS